MNNSVIQFTWRHTHKADSEEKTHTHDAFEVVYYISGEGVSVIGDKEYLYQPNTFCCIPEGVAHSEYHKTETEVVFFAFKTINALAEIQVSFLPDASGKVLKIFQEIEKENNNKKLFYKELIGTLIDKLMIVIERKRNTRKKANEMPDNIQEICRYIKLNAHLNLNTEKISKQMGYNCGYFRQEFKRYCGKSLQDYIFSERIAKVAEYLLNTDKNISEIAELCNFGSIQNLSLLFKKVEGVSPSEYRKRFKKSENKIQVKYTD